MSNKKSLTAEQEKSLKDNFYIWDSNLTKNANEWARVFGCSNTTILSFARKHDLIDKLTDIH